MRMRFTTLLFVTLGVNTITQLEREEITRRILRARQETGSHTPGHEATGAPSRHVSSAGESSKQLMETGLARPAHTGPARPAHSTGREFHKIKTAGDLDSRIILDSRDDAAIPKPMTPAVNILKRFIRNYKKSQLFIIFSSFGTGVLQICGCGISLCVLYKVLKLTTLSKNRESNTPVSDATLDASLASDFIADPEDNLEYMSLQNINIT